MQQTDLFHLESCLDAIASVIDRQAILVFPSDNEILVASGVCPPRDGESWEVIYLLAINEEVNLSDGSHVKN